ncbi:DUF421 domain-containing protein [Chungangia koreensis]|uniref:DUF421 domain-containing protein n=1 Tax=Chungangia koreensis TaxID=752657 RepID=A0ABV8X0N8_9LACT
MDWNLIWKTVLIFIVGTIILRLAGRKSISQMTIPETVLVLAIGTLLIQPLADEGYWTTFGISFILVLTLLAFELIQIRSDRYETIISGKSIVVIQNGQLLETNLKKLRLTTDKLESHLRQAGISSISDVEIATIEPSGLLGYQLKKEKQPATKEDIQQLIQLIQSGKLSNPPTPSTENIFTEITSDTQDPPKRLQ